MVNVTLSLGARLSHSWLGWRPDTSIDSPCDLALQAHFFIYQGSNNNANQLILPSVRHEQTCLFLNHLLEPFGGTEVIIPRSSLLLVFSSAISAC